MLLFFWHIIFWRTHLCHIKNAILDFIVFTTYKNEYLINKREQVGIKHYDDSKAFIECSNDMQGI